MPVDAYINFTPANKSMMAIGGESQDSYFGVGGKITPSAFEIKDFSFDIENKTSIGSATSGAGGGRVQFGQFSITKFTDQSTNAFFKNCVTGTHYSLVNLYIRKAGATPDSSGAPYLVYQFGTVFTVKIEWSGPGDETGPEEKITFAYGQLGITYFFQKADGTMDGSKSTPVSWDQLKNTTWSSFAPFSP
jgi:type VI protein secretion system component Hcp